MKKIIQKYNQYLKLQLNDKSHIVSNYICTLINEKPEIIITANTRNKPNTFPSRFNIASNDIYTPINEKEIEHIIIGNTGNEPNTSPTPLKSEKYWKIKYKKLNDMFKKKLRSIIKKVFTDDQIRALVSKSNKGYKWSENIIKKAI